MGTDRDYVAATTITVAVAYRGRVTGWSVVCSDPEHGVMPVLAPSRSAGKNAAVIHREDQHAGRALVRVRSVKRKRGRRAA